MYAKVTMKDVNLVGWLLFVIVISAANQAAPSEGAADTIGQPADTQPLAAGNNQFALQLYARLAAGGNDNLIFSPYSVSMPWPWSMPVLGDTEAEMALSIALRCRKTRALRGLRTARQTTDSRRECIAEPLADAAHCQPPLGSTGRKVLRRFWP